MVRVRVRARVRVRDGLKQPSAVPPLAMPGQHGDLADAHLVRVRV